MAKIPELTQKQIEGLAWYESKIKQVYEIMALAKLKAKNKKIRLKMLTNVDI